MQNKTSQNISHSARLPRIWWPSECHAMHLSADKWSWPSKKSVRNSVERTDQIYNGSNGHGRVHSVFEIRTKCKPDSADMSSLACSWRKWTRTASWKHEKEMETTNQILNSALCWNFRFKLEQRSMKHPEYGPVPLYFPGRPAPPPHINLQTWISQICNLLPVLDPQKYGSTLAKHWKRQILTLNTSWFHTSPHPLQVLFLSEHVQICQSLFAVTSWSATWTLRRRD